MKMGIRILKKQDITSVGREWRLKDASTYSVHALVGRAQVLT